MANFRQIHVSIWKDPWFMDLEPDQKLLYIYLFSNESTSLSGLYEIPFRVICFETCLEPDFVKKSLVHFKESGKVKYENGVIWVKNLRKYNASSAETVQIRIRKDLAKVPDCPIKSEYISYYSKNIPYRYDTDILFTEEKRNEEKRNEEKTDGIGHLFSIYEQEIGPLTPMISDEIGDWAESYSNDWIEDAIKIASQRNKRNSRYIYGILKNWQTEGRGDKNQSSIESQLKRKGYAKR